MERDFFDPPWEHTNVILVDAAVLHQAERCICSCEACDPDEAQFPFDYVLDWVTGNDPKVTDYVLADAATCPRCANRILEKTLVGWRSDDETPDAPSPVYDLSLKNGVK